MYHCLTFGAAVVQLQRNSRVRVTDILSGFPQINQEWDRPEAREGSTGVGGTRKAEVVVQPSRGSSAPIDRFHSARLIFKLDEIKFSMLVMQLIGAVRFSIRRITRPDEWHGPHGVYSRLRKDGMFKIVYGKVSEKIRVFFRIP